MENKTKKGYGPAAIGALSVAFELGFAIALPIVIFGLVGKWVDQRNGTHYFVFIAILVALLTSITYVYKRFSAMVGTLKKAANQDQQKQ